MAETKKEIYWINCVKAISILMVLVLHTENILYSSPDFQKTANTCIVMFILVAGFLRYKSDSHHEYTYLQALVHTTGKLLAAYAFAVFIFQWVWFHCFDFYTYLIYLVHFNISGPHYYVLLYVMLMAVEQPMYHLLSRLEGKKGTVGEILIGILLIAFGALANNRTNILDVMAGGGKLLGGTYLFVFYLGMVFAKHGTFEKEHSAKGYGLIWLVCTGLWTLGWRLECTYGLLVDSYLPFGEGFNPPGVTSVVLGLFMLGALYGLFCFLECFAKTKAITVNTAKLGRHTLYIFLYHRLFLDYGLQGLPLGNPVIKWIVYFAVMIFGSILIELGVHYALGKIRKDL